VVSENLPEIKILLVDDREDNLLSLEALLSPEGYQFVKAYSGRQALKVLLKEHDFSLILMDVQMPDLNGFETAELIHSREKLKHIPIIFLTAFHGEENIFRGYQSGAVDYIFKPINPGLLRAKVAVFVELYRKNHLLMAQERKLMLINNALEERVRERTEELVLKNQELETTNHELQRINNDLDNFVYTASHDLKGPIANIEGLIAVLNKKLKGRITDQEDQLFEMVRVCIGKFNSTIKDLTEISRVQKDVQEQPEVLSFHGVLVDVKQDIASLIDEYSAHITEDFGVPEVVYARKNLRSILYNLLTNAIKYRSPDRLPHIHIRTYPEDTYTVLCVQDNGLGLDKSQQAKLFTMFKRMHTHVEGSGIGLYIIKRIIENYGGKIHVDSEPGKGTRFSVYFKHSEVLYEDVQTVSE
jgi:two-component system, sensor histidine kinase and response regulator